MNSLFLFARLSVWLPGVALGLALIGDVRGEDSPGAKSRAVHEAVVLRPRHGAGGDAFGFAVDIKDDVAVVGAAEDSDRYFQSGAVYVFERNPSGAWIEAAKLFAQDPGPCQHFGSSVALDGDRLVIGQRGVECPPDGDLIASSVYVFEKRAGGWEHSAKLQPPSNARFNFAFFTALDRKVALAGQEKNAYAYRRRADGGWSGPVTLPASAAVGDDEYSGPRLDVSGNTVVLGSTGLALDAAFVDIYQAESHATWRRAMTIELPQPGTDFWGRPHVDIEGDVLLVDRFVYERKANGSWRRTATLLPSDAPAPDEFPGELALSRRGIAVLTAFEFIGQDFPTSAYVYRRISRGVWKRAATLTPAQSGARFFGRIDTDGRGVISGGITAQGERVAYVFEIPRGGRKTKR